MNLPEPLPFEILPLEHGHIAQAAEIERACFSLPWTEEMLEGELSNPLARYFAAVGAVRLAGYVGAHVVAGEGYITNVAVHPDFRRRGVASALILRLERECREAEFLSLEVRVSNAAAIALYARHGFSRSGIRKNYYERPAEDALIMTKLLKAEKGKDYGHDAR